MVFSRQSGITHFLRDDEIRDLCLDSDSGGQNVTKFFAAGKK